MATNKYKGNSSAYGVGRFFEEMEGRKESLHNPIVQAQGSYGSGTSSTTSNPVQSISNNEIGANAGSQAIQNLTNTYGIPTSMNNAIDLRNKSVKGGVDGGYDFYQQGINKQGDGGDIYSNFDASNWDMNSKAGIDMTSNFGSNLEVGKTLSANPSSSTSELPNFANQGYGPKTPGQYQKIGSDPTMDYEKALDLAAVKNERDRQAAAVDNIWDPGLPTTEGLGNNLPMTTVANPKNTWEKNLTASQLQKINASEKLTPYELQHKRAAQKAAHKKMLKASGITSEETDWQQQMKSADGNFAPVLQDEGGVANLDSIKDELSSLWDQDIEDPFSVGEDIAGSLTPNSVVDSVPGEVSTLGKVGSTLGKAGEAIGKAAPYIAAGANVLSTFSQMDRRSGVIDDLGKGVNRVESMIGNMANQEHAELRAMADEYAEGNRRIGEGQNLQLGNRLDAVKGSNLNTGSIKRIKEDLTDDFQRTTDLSLASAATAFEKQTDQFHADSRDTRAKANEELKQLREELKEQERQQAMAPFSLAADLAIGVVGASNPLLGMGLSAVKNKAFA